MSPAAVGRVLRARDERRLDRFSLSTLLGDDLEAVAAVLRLAVERTGYLCPSTALARLGRADLERILRELAR